MFIKYCITFSNFIHSFRAVENSEWMQNLSVILQCSGNIVNLMNMLGASVMLVLEDGWDFTSQVSILVSEAMELFIFKLKNPLIKTANFQILNFI